MSTSSTAGKSSERKGAKEKQGSGTAPPPTEPESVAEESSEADGEAEDESGAELTEPELQKLYSFAIRDALHVYNAAMDHRDATSECGVLDEELATFKKQIDLAVKAEGSGGRLSLEKARETVRDLLGLYRTAARMACSSLLTGHNPALAKKLLCDGQFPETDAALDATLTAIDKPMKTSSAALERRNFKPEQQDALRVAAKAFRGARKSMPKKNASLKAKIDKKKRIFDSLKIMTSYVRTIGHGSLKNSSTRSDFDRPVPKVNPEAKAEAAVKRAKKDQQRMEEEAAVAKVDLEAKTKRAEDLKAARTAKKGKKKGKK